MARFLHHSLKISGRNWRDFLLALSWILGLISGCTLCLSADTTAFSLMRMAPGCPVSIVRLLAVTFLPILFSGFAAFVSQTWLLIPIAFFKSFTFSAAYIAVMLSFGSAGWLIGFLLMFSSICTMPILILYWIRYSRKGYSLALWHKIAFISLIFAVCGIDFFVISPFLAGL